MTTFNCAPFIGQAIKSILNQTYKEFEFLIIDDGSTDSTADIVECFKDERMKYIKRDHLGRSAALNYGLKNAKHDIIALMDADDISHPKRIETQFMNLQNNFNEVVVTNGAYFKGKKILHYTKISEDLQEFKKKLLLHGPYYHPTMMFYKDHVLNNGGYNTKLKANEDHELWLRLKDISKFKIINNILYYYRIRFDSLSNNAFIKEPQITYDIQEFYFKDLEKYFRITSKYEKYILNGWREYFYGSPIIMRNQWSKVEIKFWDFRMLIAYLISFFSKNLINFIKMSRMRLRLQYLFNKIITFNIIQREFNKMIIALDR